MYNNIGLRSVKGSCTNGRVEKNVASLPSHETPNYVDYDGPRKDETNSVTTEDQIYRPLHKDIVDHMRKRDIELKCLELVESLTDRGLNQDEIDSEVQWHRKVLELDYEDEKKSEILHNKRTQEQDYLEKVKCEKNISS